MTQPSDKPAEDSAIPEVEAEIVTGSLDEASDAAPFDDAPASDAPSDSVSAKPLAPLRSPGVILFGVFALLALGVFAWWRLTPREAATVADETAVAAPAEVSAPSAISTATEPKIANTPADGLKRPDHTAATPSDATPASATPDTGYLPPVTDAGAAKIANPVEEGAKEAMLRLREADAARAESPQDQPTEDAPIGAPDDTAALAAESEALAEPEAQTLADQPEFAESEAPPVMVAPAADPAIANELAALKRRYAADTQKLAAALEVEQRVSAERASEVDALREALAARDAQNAEELAALRASLEKMQNEEVAAPAQHLRASFALSALKRAMDQGAPYREELNVLAQFAPDADAALGAYADAGVASERTLRGRFDDAARAAMSAAAQEKAGGGVKGLIARAQNIVSVRPAVATTGDTPGAILSRAEHALNQGETQFALLQLEDLPLVAQEAMADWISDARARAEMETAVGLLQSRLAGDVE